LLAELYKSTDKTKASYYFQKAHSVAKTQTQKQNIQQKIDNLL
jgi:RNA polymerase sigma-70 factor (ECF subfamily)